MDGSDHSKENGTIRRTEETKKPARPAARMAAARRYSRDEILNIAAAALLSAKIRFKRSAERGFIEFTMELKNCKAMGPVRVMVIPNGESAMLSYAVCPVRAEENVRREAAEYLLRVNQGLGVGSFEMDFDSGEIRYKSFLLLHGPLPPRDVVLRYIVVTYLMLDRFGDGLLRVLLGMDTAKQAVSPKKLN